MNEPPVTVCVPVYNAAETLPSCLDAVLEQTIPGMEVLVVDNASTDGSADLAAKVLAGRSGVRVVRNPSNLGRIENWNRCIELASGSYLKFIMASDVLWRGAVSCLLEHALTNPGAVMVGSRHSFWNGVPAPVPSVGSQSPVTRMDTLTVLRRVRDGENPFWALNGMLMRSDAIHGLGLRFVPEIPYLADVHFCAGLAMAGDTLFVEAPTYWFNTGLRGRFHYKGADPAPYFEQARRMYVDVAKLLESRGDGPGDPQRSLLRNLQSCLRDGSIRPGLVTTYRLFEDAPFSYRVSAVNGWMSEKLRLRRAYESLSRWLLRTVPTAHATLRALYRAARGTHRGARP